jgi:polyferredoxin
VVCPTGIDIRNGLQLDCIGCTRCIDACDDVMDKLHRPRGLVRYDSLKRPPHRSPGASSARGSTSTPSSAYTVEGEMVRNAYNIHLVNKHNARVVFTLAPDTSGGQTFVLPLREVALDSLAGADAPVFVTMPVSRVRPGAKVRVRIIPRGMPAEEARTIEAPFLGPQ